MVAEHIRGSFCEAVAEVFDTMYFLSVVENEGPPSPQEWDGEPFIIKAHISFSGPEQAVLDFYFPWRLARNIAEGFLGINSGALTDNQLIDTMREAANMVVGRFLGKIDQDGACKLSIPTATQVNSLNIDELTEGGDFFAFLTDFGMLLVTYN